MVASFRKQPVPVNGVPTYAANRKLLRHTHEVARLSAVGLVPGCEVYADSVSTTACAVSVPGTAYAGAVPALVTVGAVSYVTFAVRVSACPEESVPVCDGCHSQELVHRRYVVSSSVPSPAVNWQMKYLSVVRVSQYPLLRMQEQCLLS